MRASTDARELRSARRSEKKESEENRGKRKLGITAVWGGVESRIGGTPQGRPFDFSPILKRIRLRDKNNGEGCLFKDSTFAEKIKVKVA